MGSWRHLRSECHRTLAIASLRFLSAATFWHVESSASDTGASSALLHFARCCRLAFAHPVSVTRRKPPAMICVAFRTAMNVGPPLVLYVAFDHSPLCRT